MKRLLSLLGLLLGIPLALAQSSGVNGIGGVTISGNVTAGHCAQFTAGGQISDAGLACGGSFTGVTTTGTPASGNIAFFSGANTITGTTNILPVANGGSGTATPSLVAGTNVTISGSWPNQTVNSTASGMTWPAGGAGIPNYSGTSSWGTSYSATNTIPANFISTLNQNTTGNAATATALAATPTQCTGSQFATGIAASGNANCATPSGSGTVTTTGTPASGQITQFSGSTSITTATAGNVLSLINSQTCNAQSGTTYTFVLGDANNCVTMANAAANTITIPTNATVAFPVGTTETVIQTGAGATTLQGAGSPVTLQSAKFGSSTSQTYAFAAEYSCVSVQKTATDTWFVSSCDYNPGSGSGVTSFTGDGTLISNSGSTGAVTATIASAAANSLWGNTSGSSGAPGYHAFNSTELAILADTTAIVASVCTPSASSLAPTTGGTITQPGTPCTTVTFTFAVAAPHGWNCSMGDITQTNAGTYIPTWVESSGSTTTCVVKIPSAAQVASDVLSLQSSWY